MQFNQERDPTSYSIRGYTDEEIIVHPPIGQSGERVSLEHLSDRFLMTPNRLVRGWGPTDIEDLRLDEAHLSELLDIGPEVLLFGTGVRQRLPDARLMVQLHENGIGVEFMDNLAACRTYNILMAEGRDVALAVFFD